MLSRLLYDKMCPATFQFSQVSTPDWLGIAPPMARANPMDTRPRIVILGSHVIGHKRTLWVTFLLIALALGPILSCGGEGQTVLFDSSAPTAESGQAATVATAPTPFPEASTTATLLPTSQPTPEPTAIATPEPTPAATHTPTPEPTAVPTPTSEPTPVPTPSSKPTLTPRPTLTPVPPQVPLGPYGSIQTGPEVVGMEVFDRLMPEIMHKHNLPGGALAIVKDGRLVFARGYGLADIQNQEPVEPDSLFRVASLSKPVTAIAVLKLVEDGKLDLDEKAFEILSHFQEPEGTSRDPRIDQVTVRQLLHHAGGWDKDVSFDPLWNVGMVGRSTGVPAPVSCSDVISFMLGRSLDFDPGARYAYSNFGYCILGRIVEEKAGQDYETYVIENILTPVGITAVQVGGTLLEERAEGEVRYYHRPGASLAWSVLPDGPERVPWPYGGFYMGSNDSVGGWIASTVDFVRLVSALDGSRPPAPLMEETVDLMLSRPDPPLQDSNFYYAMGWGVLPIGDSARWSHGGGLPGSSSLIVRSHDGITWAVFFNSWAAQYADFRNDRRELTREGIASITTWPSHDLFPLFGYE